MSVLSCAVEFGGGLELLFGKIKKYELNIPLDAASADAPVAITPVGLPAAAPKPVSGGCGSKESCGACSTPSTVCEPVPPQRSADLPPAPVTSPLTLGAFILWVRDHVLTERPDLFVVGDKL
jgi:hypothetical protein